MSAKALQPNQCTPLHWIYGKEDCCLCRANKRIEELEAEVPRLNPKDIDLIANLVVERLKEVE